MNELFLTAIRFGFLGLLWLFIIVVLLGLRRDLRSATDVSVTTPNPKNTRTSAGVKTRSAKSSPKNIEVLDGPLAGATMALSGADITIGRAPDCSIVISDDYASSKHTRLRRVDGRWFAEDLESTNGTWVNRKRITAPTALTVGTVVSVGRTNFRIDG